MKSQEEMTSMPRDWGRNQSRQTWRGWLERFFIFAAFVVLPAVVYWYISFFEVTTQAEFEKERFRRELTNQAQKVPDHVAPERTLAFFCESALKHYRRDGKDGLGRYLERLEKKYPQALLWAFWGSDKRLITGDFPQYLPGEKSMQAIMDLAFHKMENPLETIESLPGLDSVNAISMRSFGGGNIFRRFFEARGAFALAQCLGREGKIFWDLIKPVWATGTKALVGFEGVGLVFAETKELPEEFGLSEMIQFRSYPEGFLKHPMIVFSTRDPDKIWVDKRLQRYPRLGEQLRERFLRDPKESIEVGNWLAANVSFPKSGFPFRCLVVGDSRGMARDGELRMRAAAQIALLWFAFGSVLLFLQGWGVVLFLDSLKIRLTGAFLLAMLLPILGLGWTGSSFLEAERERLLQGIKDKALERFRQVELRFQRFQEQQELLWQNQMSGLVGKHQSSLVEIQKGLESMAEDGLFTHFYLSDPEGKIFATNYEIKEETDRRSLNAISLMLKMILSTRRDSEIFARLQKEESKALLHEELRETAVQSFGQEADPRKFLKTGRLFRTNMGSLRGFSMSLFFGFEGKLRLIWIWASNLCIERSFVRAEIERWKIEDPSKKAFPFEIAFLSRFDLSNCQPQDLANFGELGQHLSQLKNPKTSMEETGTGNLVGYYYFLMPVTFLDNYSIVSIENLEPLYEKVALGKRRLWGAMGLMALFASMLGIILSGGLVRPISNLDKAFGEVKDGNLAVVLPEMGRDEIGRLGATFNTMVAQLRERERMRAYVSGSVLEKVRDEHASCSHVSQYRAAAILFSDIRGFTSLSEKYPPAKIFEMLNGFLGGVEGIISAHNGDVDKFIGDAVMAVFLGEERMIARAAVEAALDMRVFIEHFNRERTAVDLFPIEIGIGINTGNVLWGDIGSSKRKDSTVIGDEVNLASRLESASKLGRHTRIVISESTFVQVEDLVEAEEMSVREVKGKAQAVKMYEIISLKPRNATQGS